MVKFYQLVAFEHLSHGNPTSKLHFLNNLVRRKYFVKPDIWHDIDCSIKSLKVKCKDKRKKINAKIS